MGFSKQLRELDWTAMPWVFQSREKDAGVGVFCWYRRWTKYDKISRKRSDLTPPNPQMSELNNVCVMCHAVRFDLFCPPVSTLGRRKLH